VLKIRVGLHRYKEGYNADICDKTKKSAQYEYENSLETVEGKGEASEINSEISDRACWENVATVNEQTVKQDGREDM
jgi:hypothetical protein